ncbi:MAG: PEP-CTERM sorting domain-containing protein [Armatimonadota bacterium]
MNRILVLALAVSSSASIYAQSFTTSLTSGSGVSAAGVNVVPGTPGQTLTGSGTYTLQPAGSGFNRYDVRVTQNRVIAPFGLIDPPAPSSSTTLNGVTTTSTASNTNVTTTSLFGRQSGATFTLGASATHGNIIGQSASASTLISVAQAPLITGSFSSTSSASAGSPVVGVLSSATLWVFNFPGDPATGTATINLSNAAANFARGLDSLSVASQHRDNLRLEVRAFLNGVQVGSTATVSNTTLGVNIGSTSSSLALSSIPSITLTPADIYNQSKALTVETRLIGTAFFGDTTNLGDYTIASSTFSGVTVQGVPEPASIAGLSLGLLAFARRRKSK